MKISKPKNITWWISVIAGGLGVIGHFVSIPFVSEFSFWFVVAGLGLLALGCAVKGL
jgi:hypothetical protein